MRDNTQIMLFIAHLPWDGGILTGMDTGTQAMVSFGFRFPSTPLFLAGCLNSLPSMALSRFSPLSYLALSVKLPSKCQNK